MRGRHAQRARGCLLLIHDADKDPAVSPHVSARRACWAWAGGPDAWQARATRARVVHRLGDVPVGEASVIVVVSSAHRGPAFEACRYLMDRLKSEVPIWKREVADLAGIRYAGVGAR